MTAEELAIFNSPHKGAYSYTDYNRVGEAMTELQGLLSGIGITVTITARTDWAATDNITATDRAAYLADLNTIKDAFYGTTELPEAWDKITLEDANNVEKMLLEIEWNIYCMLASVIYAGEAVSGEF
jgi:hypothetical protein